MDNIRKQEHIVDRLKCEALKRELGTRPGPQIVSIERFFDGNDDLGSIGCNLRRHPGMHVFRETLIGLLSHPKIEGVYAQICELDPGEGCWPFADTVLVTGNVSTNELERIVATLQPSEVRSAEEFGIRATALSKYDSPITAIWWD